jgi:diguanylate cyclase (GGDEF)-like protein
MAASEQNTRIDRPAAGGTLSRATADAEEWATLRARLDEEIARAERYGTGLCCLLVVIENLERMAHEHGEELREQTLEYVAGALRRELRRFDRVGRPGQASDHELLIILPGADSPRGEMVARRTLERLRTIKVEAAGERRALEVSVGLAAWRENVNAEALVAQARMAARNIGDGRAAARTT